MVPQTLNFPPFHLLSNVDVLYCDGAAVSLEPQAVRVLRYLIEQHQRVVSKDELLEKLWPDTFTTDDVLKKAISQARRALGDDANEPRYIRTWHGRGYQFIAALQDANVITNVAASLDNAAPQKTALHRADPDYDQLMGRETELQMLCAEYRNALNGTGRPVLIAGEPGVGKTQLARYFGEWVKAQGGQLLYGRFFDYDGSRLAPYETFLDLLRTACGLHNTETRPDREALSRVLAERFGIRLPEELFAHEPSEFPASLVLAVPAAPLRVDFAAHSDDAFQAIVPLGQSFIRLSRQQPLVLVLDDLQWAGDGSRELLGWLMRNAEEARLLIVLLTRVEETADAAHSLHQWLKRQASYRSFTTLTLKPLDEAAFRQTIERAFVTLDIPAAQVRALHRVTGGNPYFLTEMLRLLVAEGVIQRQSPEQWQWRAPESLKLPANLTLAAEAKLDRLSSEVREIAEQAAVIGDEFRLETLAQMTGRDENALELLLAEAVRRGILSEHGVSVGEHFRFYHSILRRVLYERLVPRLRAKAHLRAAAAAETVYAFESDRVAEAISAHYEQGGDWQRAYEWSLRAWQAARQRWQWSEAASALERAWRAAAVLAQRDAHAISTQDKLRIQLGLGELYNATARFREAETSLTTALAQAQAIHETPLVVAAQRELSRTLYDLSRYDEALAYAVQARTGCDALDDTTGAALALLVQCRIHAAQGNCAAVEQASQAVFALVPNEDAIAAEARGMLGWALALQGRYAEAQPLLERALAHLQRAGDLRQQANLQRRLHWVHLSRGQYETSFQYAQRARDDYRNVGDASGEAKLNMSLGQVRLAQGLYDESLSYFQRTLQSLQELGDRHCEAETYWLMGRAYGEQGQTAQANPLLTRALAMVRELGDRDDEFRVLTDLARVQLVENDFTNALAFSQQAAQIAIELGNRDGHGLALVETAQALHALRQVTKAIPLARQAVALLTESGSGEQWRAQYALGLVLRESDKPAALAALRQAIALLDAIREQVNAAQIERRTKIASARQAPTQMLQRLVG